MGGTVSKAAKSAGEAARSSMVKQRETLHASYPGGPFGYSKGGVTQPAAKVPDQGAFTDVSTEQRAQPSHTEIPNAQPKERKSNLGTYKPVEHAPPSAPAPPRKLEKVAPIAPIDMTIVRGKAPGAAAPSGIRPPGTPVDRTAQAGGQDELLDTTPRDADAAEVQRMAMQARAAPEGAGAEAGHAGAGARAVGSANEAVAEGDAGSATVAVTRLKSSGPVPSEAARIHEKNDTTVRNVESFDGSVQTLPLHDPGMRSVAVWAAMQENPELLDTPAALARSATAAAALGVLQLSLGNRAAAPHGTVLIGDGKDKGRPHVASSEDKDGTGGLEVQGKEDGPVDALVLTEATADALVPVGKTLDDSLIALRDPGKDVVAWGPRPHEGSVYDQLIISGKDEELLLDRGELFEMFARARADPGYWTPLRLAEFYGTRKEWVAALLEAVSPPIFTVVDGEAYGVYDIRPEEDYGKPVFDYAAAERQEQDQGRDGDRPATATAVGSEATTGGAAQQEQKMQ